MANDETDGEKCLSRSQGCSAYGNEGLWPGVRFITYFVAWEATFPNSIQCPEFISLIKILVLTNSRFMKPGGQSRIHKGSPIILIISQINWILPISLRSVLIVSSHLCLQKFSFLLVLKEILFFSILNTLPAQFNLPDYIRWTVQTMNFHIMEPSSLPILIALEHEYAITNDFLEYKSIYSDNNSLDGKIYFKAMFYSWKLKYRIGMIII